MTEFLLGNPVPGYIHRKGWQRPAGNAEFVVVRTMADHVAAREGTGTDFGNKRCGGPIYAMADGIVTSRYIQVAAGVGKGALIVRLTHGDGWSTGYAHMSAFSVKLKQAVKRGQQIGVLGGTGGVPCHLHADARRNNVKGTDLETRLEQNHNLQLNPGVSGVNLREGPDTSAPIWAVAKADGIWRNQVRLCGHDVTLTRRPEATVTADGYEWMPILLPVSVQPLWVARPFVHFL